MKYLLSKDGLMQPLPSHGRAAYMFLVGCGQCRETHSHLTMGVAKDELCTEQARLR